MPTNRKWMMLGAAALCSAVFAAPLAAVSQDKPDAGDKAIKARQGFMQVVVWEVGPLFGMAKGEVEYDAERAAGNAESLNALVQYDVGRLFIQGTSKADRPGKTRSLADIWSKSAEFQKAIDDWRAATAVVAAEAGNGQAALAAAVGGMGKTCGGCHKPFRAEEF